MICNIFFNNTVFQALLLVQKYIQTSYTCRRRFGYIAKGSTKHRPLGMDFFIAPIQLVFGSFGGAIWSGRFTSLNSVSASFINIQFDWSGAMDLLPSASFPSTLISFHSSRIILSLDTSELNMLNCEISLESLNLLNLKMYHAFHIKMFIIRNSLWIIGSIGPSHALATYQYHYLFLSRNTCKTDDMILR